MSLHQLALLFVAVLLSCSSAQSMFARFQTKQVPIDRLFTNLQRRLTQNTNDFAVSYHLARLHSMAFATNLLEVSVRTEDEVVVFYRPDAEAGVPKEVHLPATATARQAALQHLTNAIRLYERAIVLLKQSTNAVEQRWMVLPTQLGLAWCLDQTGRREEALQAYRTTLK